MDDLDALILRELGMEPFIAWPRRHAGHKFADIARKLGRNPQFVKDRVSRMEEAGVITSYRVFPNLRHVGLDYTVFRLRSGSLPEESAISRLGAVDGFVGAVWGLDSVVCLDLIHAGPGQRARRLELVGNLVEGDAGPVCFYERSFPEPQRTLSPLDWRILQALTDDARRPLSDVADEVGATAKTVRTRFHRMRDEGSLDEHITIDFSKMSGIIPFQIAVWFEDGATGTDQRILETLRDRYLAHFHPPDDAYSSFLFRIFAHSPAEVQDLVRQTIAVDGVRAAEPVVATGSYYDERWLQELLDRQVEGTA